MTTENGGPLPGWVAGLLIFALAFGVYHASQVQQLGDAEFTVLVSEQLTDHGSFELDAYFWPNQPVRFYPGMKPGMRWPRQVQPGGVRRAELRAQRADGSGPRGTEPAPDLSAPLHYIYPHGTSILAAPLVAGTRALGWSAIAEDGSHDMVGERRIQRLLSSLVAAFACVLFFTMARRFLGVGWSLGVSFAAAFSTQMWSTVSRSLQSHTLNVLLLGGALWILARPRGSGEPGARLGTGTTVALATFLSWGFFVRPTAVLYIVPLTLYVAWQHRRDFPVLAGVGALWLGAFIAYSQATFGTWLPDYYTRGSGFELQSWPTGLYGQLLSPSRGLLVFVPLVALAGYLCLRYRPRLPMAPLALVAWATVGVHVLVMGAFRNWWGGHCYGPRFSSDLVPLFVLAGILGLKAALEARSRGEVSARRRRLEWGLAAAALLVGVVLNGAGAVSPGGQQWCLWPVPIGEDPGRCLDWSNPQWWRALFPLSEG